MALTKSRSRRACCVCVGGGILSLLEEALSLGEVRVSPAPTWVGPFWAGSCLFRLARVVARQVPAQTVLVPPGCLRRAQMGWIWLLTATALAGGPPRLPLPPRGCRSGAEAVRGTQEVSGSVPSSTSP